MSPYVNFPCGVIMWIRQSDNARWPFDGKAPHYENHFRSTTFTCSGGSMSLTFSFVKRDLNCVEITYYETGKDLFCSKIK